MLRHLVSRRKVQDDDRTTRHTDHTTRTSQPISTHQYVSAKDRLIGKPRFHFEPTQVMQLLRQRIIGQDAALNEIEKMRDVVKADFSSTERPLRVT